MPATGNFVLDKGYDAAVALTKYKAVKMSAEETVTPVTTKTDVVIGVPQFDVATADIPRGKGASIRVEGATEMVAGGTCTVGGLAGLMPDGSVHDAVTGDRVIGMFRQGAASGNRCSVVLDLPGSLI
jgi:hypothetical protein